MSKNPQPNKGGWEGIDLTPTLSLLRRGGFKPHPYQGRESDDENLLCHLLKY